MITCDKCAYCSPTPGGSLYCALTDHFVPNLGCKDGEPINNPKTNADRIRSMSDEELATMFYGQGAFAPNCNRGHRDVCYASCRDCWLKWLKEEVKDG